MNANDITHRTITRGEFHRSEHMAKTLSDAINIQVPYNMERVLYYLTGQDTALIRTWMAEMDATGRLTLPANWLQKMQEVFASARVDDEAMCACIRKSAEEYSYLPCPHSAVALAAHFATCETAVPRVVFATASPCKFEHSVATALGSDAWKRYQDANKLANQPVLSLFLCLSLSLSPSLSLSLSLSLFLLCGLAFFAEPESRCNVVQDGPEFPAAAHAVLAAMETASVPHS